jgi:hypothetical protein
VRVESSLAEMIMNAIAAGRVWGVQFMRKHGKDPGDERRTFEDLNRVIEKRLDSALSVARENGQRAAEAPPWLSDAAEALGEVRPDDGAPKALNWTQVIQGIRDLRRELFTARETIATLKAELEAALVEAQKESRK